MTSSALLREARLRAGLAQRELARRAGTAQSAIARWESGRATPSFETLVRLVRACGLELSIGLSDSEPQEVSLIERNLSLTPEQRLIQLQRTVAFLQAGRAALRKRRG